MPVALKPTPTPVPYVSYARTDQEYEVNTVKDLDYSVYKMRNGDVVTAEAILNRFINKLEIRGAVYRPGIYQLNGKLNTVRELVNEAQRPDR